jgi:competence protein ComGC
MRLRRDERGFVLITAMIVLAVFMMLTVAVVMIVDVQTNQTGHERSGEAAFTLAESALRAEAYQLQVAWPVSSAQALPSCTSATPQKTGCEGTALTQELQATTPGPDYAHATWSAQAFDNTQPTYSPALASSAPAWDANGDNTMWVRAQATANGQTRTVIEQVTRRLQTLSLPENVVTAGGLYTQSNGVPTIINATDSASGVTGPVAVRCGTAGTQPPQGNCAGWQPGQLSPATAYQAGYIDPSGSSSALTPAEVDSLIQEAQAAHTLYNIGSTPDPAAISGCPPDGATYSPPPGGTHPVVVVEGAGACPSSTSTYKQNWFSATNPGVLVFLQGSIALGGSQNHSTFYGLLFMLNQGGPAPAPGSACSSAQLSSAPTLVTISGSALVDGGIFVDGCGLVDLQDNGDALNFSLSAFQALQTYGTAAAAPDTFRDVSG